MKLIECPRDAMQGMKEWIPTEIKTTYINELLQVGFDTIDFGSFVSPKAIPQMRDTAQVVESLDMENSKSKLLAIVANQRGADDASAFDQISYLGYPFSISETFQQRNTNASIEESLKRVEGIQKSCMNKSKTLVVYISMAFGNPYGDEWSADVAADWTRRLKEDLGVTIIQLSDTIGVSNPENIDYLFSSLIPEFPDIEIGAHLHTTPDTLQEKVEAAYNAGCRRFDGAIKGFGGCPMAKDDLTGNMATEGMVTWFDENNINHGLDTNQLQKCIEIATSIFPQA